MPRVELEADTIEELVDMVRRWVAGYPEIAANRDAKQEPPPESLEDVLTRIKSAASRCFLHAVAAQTLAGEALTIDDALRARCDLPPGGAIVGVLGVANRTMRLRAHRDLVMRDSATGGYRMSFEDARIVAECLGPPD